MNKDTFSKIIKAATLVLITALTVPVYSQVKQESPANSENQQDYIVVFKDSFRGKIDEAKSLLISGSSKRSSPLNFKNEINDLIPAVVVPLTEAEAKRI